MLLLGSTESTEIGVWRYEAGDGDAGGLAKVATGLSSRTMEGTSCPFEYM